MNKLIPIALLLFVLWVVVAVTKVVVGLVFHLLWVGAVLIFLFWAVRKIF